MRKTSFSSQQASLSFLFKPETTILSNVKANEQWDQVWKGCFFVFVQSSSCYYCLACRPPSYCYMPSSSYDASLPEILGNIGNAAYACEHCSVAQLIDQLHLVRMIGRYMNDAVVGIVVAERASHRNNRTSSIFPTFTLAPERCNEQTTGMSTSCWKEIVFRFRLPKVIWSLVVYIAVIKWKLCV